MMGRKAFMTFHCYVAGLSHNGDAGVEKTVLQWQAGIERQVSASSKGILNE